MEISRYLKQVLTLAGAAFIGINPLDALCNNFLEDT